MAADDGRDRFAAAILASYRQTLDCPGLLGLRDIDDIIADLDQALKAAHG